MESPKCPFSTNDILRDRLETDWILREKLQSECNVVEKVSEYYRNQRAPEIHAGTNDHLILQRTIGYPSLVGNQKWIGRAECYVCGRWQITCMMYKPDLKAKMNRKRGPDGELVDDEYYISGSWESLMQGYGDEVWTKSKMIPINRFVEDFDPHYVSYEQYEKEQMENMQEDQTELLMKQTRKMAAVKAVWRQDYDKEFLERSKLHHEEHKEAQWPLQHRLPFD